MPTIYEIIESNLVTRLVSKIGNTDHSIRNLAENDGQNLQAAQKPLIEILYSNSEFGKDENQGAVVQEEKMGFEVIIEAKKRLGDLGIYAYIAAVKLALLGYYPPGCSKPLKGGTATFVTRSPNWVYMVSFTCAAYAVECPDDETDVALTQMNFNLVQVNNQDITPPRTTEVS